MPIASETFTRREALAGLGVGAAALVLPGCATTSRAAAATDPAALLDEIAYNLLAHEPERATTLGVDVGPYAALRGKLERAAVIEGQGEVGGDVAFAQIGHCKPSVQHLRDRMWCQCHSPAGIIGQVTALGG